MAKLVKTFTTEGDFSACTEAEEFLKLAGFSVGTMQRGDPRGILFGDYDIMKWRNLDKRDREALHGILVGPMRTGPVRIQIFESAPQEAKRAFHSTATAAALVAGE